MSRVTLALVVSLALMIAACGYGSKYNGGMGGAAPSLMQLVPNSEKAGGQAFTLTVKGTGFGTDAVVYWNGVAHMTSYQSTTQATAAITAADIMNPGMVPVYVRSGAMNSNIIDFTVQ